MLQRLNFSGLELLVDRVLDSLPDSVWKDSTVRFLDPDIGYGRGIIARTVEKRLRELGYSEENISSRVYGYATEPVIRNALVAKYSLVGNYEVKNVLEEKINMKFDLVIMNPPYNKPVHETGRKGGYGGRTLWDKFLHKAIDEWVEEGGYVCSINPSSWRKPPTDENRKLYEKITKNQLEYLEINSKKRGKQIFGASTRFDCLVLKKSESNGVTPTTIVDEQGQEHSIVLSKKEFIPNYLFDKIENLLAKEGEERCEVVFSTSIYDTRKPYVSNNKNGPFIHPVVHNMTQDGYKCVYTSDNTKGHFGTSKVILSFNEKQHEPIVDFKGEYGMSQITFGIKVSSEEDGKKLANFIKSEDFKEVLEATKWSTFQTDWRMFTYFREGFWR